MLIIGLTDRRYNYRPHRVLGLVVSLGFIGLLTKKWTDKVYFRPKPVKDTDEGERWLKPGINCKGKLIGAVFVAVFWNGTTGVFVGIVAKGDSRR